MRSAFMHAPWLRHMHVVVASPSQIPSWLDVSHPRIRIVTHAELFDDAAAQLPTFNSLAIESVRFCMFDRLLIGTERLSLEIANR